ncbi:hypothetical protein PIB30_084390 [Stylosanthes scabra]|uniref:Aminotransferase-like plant mobile domain-containing protein n=1 Tax=Stylosanthes scabra TaxID=79078 RepID=A0ABU6RSU5_9FABA|nr:hypothetical protein [Stylosanthes scabra]
MCPCSHSHRGYSACLRGARDHEDGRLLRWRYRLVRCCVEDFRYTPYLSDDLRFLSPEWIRSGPEIWTWRSVISVGEDVWWLTHRTTKAWCESWMRHATDPVVIQIVPELNFRGNQEYLDWWGRACRSRFLSDGGLSEDPRVQGLSADIQPTPSHPRPDILFPPDAPARRRHQGGRAGDTGGAVCQTRMTRVAPSTSRAGVSQETKTAHRERYEDDSEEEMFFDQFESLGNSPVRHSPAHPPTPPQLADEQTQADVVHQATEATWEQPTSAQLNDIWDVTKTSASTAHDIAQGFRQRVDHARESSGVDSSDPSVGYHQMPPHPSMQFHTPAQSSHLQHFPPVPALLTPCLNFIILHLHSSSITLPITPAPPIRCS